MKTLTVRNVHAALPEALAQLETCGVSRDSRNGEVVMFPEPVTTTYLKPLERVIFWAERDANPFFHLYESIWMLLGRNDVAGVAAYVPRMATFSDDGETLHGAYGYRWLRYFGHDQLLRIVAQLKANPDDRRCVLQMWDGAEDLGRNGKDVPCNTQAVFAITHEGALDMTVFNRSNDIIWGAYGANAVHFSYLQEWVACAIGVPVGVYRQVSCNFHAYKEVLEKVRSLGDYVVFPGTPVTNPYDQLEPCPYPVMSVGIDEWRAQAAALLEEGANAIPLGNVDPWLRKVAAPVLAAWGAYKSPHGDKSSRMATARHILSHCEAADWKKACLEWLARREVAAHGA